jgi:hypothetical protein
MLLYAVASPPGVHGGGSRDGSERSLNSPESHCSIGILPVFFRTIGQRFSPGFTSQGRMTREAPVRTEPHPTKPEAPCAAER